MTDIEVALIEPPDEIPPKLSVKKAVETGDRLELPIALPTTKQLVWGMSVLAVVASLFCGLILWFFSQQKVSLSSGITQLIMFCWLIALVGPALFWFAFPNGVLKPDHWLRYDRKLGELSIRGGTTILQFDQVICIISVSDRRKRKQQTELQVLSVGTTIPYKHFVLNSRELDPRQAFGTVLEQFHDFAGLPRYYASIDEQGKVYLAET